MLLIVNSLGHVKNGDGDRIWYEKPETLTLLLEKGFFYFAHYIGVVLEGLAIAITGSLSLVGILNGAAGWYLAGNDLEHVFAILNHWILINYHRDFQKPWNLGYRLATDFIQLCSSEWLKLKLFPLSLPGGRL